MANNLWTAFIADNGSNDILAASLAGGGTWTPSVPINQTSPFTPSLALFEGVLYCAFITDDEDSATGVPSNRIFLTWTTDGVSWGPASFFNQYSKCAPSLAVWNGKLHIAFVANNPSNTLLVYLSATPQDAQSWTATVATNQTSANAPALAAYQSSGAPSQLYMAFVAENGSEDIFVCSIASGGQWSKATVTGQSCHFSPSLAVQGDTLYLVFAAANGSKDLLLCSMDSHGNWSAAVQVNQSSSATPCAAAFGADLSVAFAANDPGGQVFLASSSNPATSWTGGDVYLQQQSAAGPAIAVAPFACCYEQVTFSGTIRGNTNYVFWAGLGKDNQPIPVTGLVVEINIDSALVVNPNQGTPAGSPVGFQINGYPPTKDLLQGQVTTGWTPSAGDLATGWQQYGVKMWPGTTRLISWSQYWPPAVLQNPNVAPNFTANIPNQDTGTLPNDLTVPAGWNIRFVFNYSQQNPGTITGFDCTVTDATTGARVGPDMGLNFLSLPQPNPVVTLNELDQLVAFQVLLVGFYDKAQAVLRSGGGTITVQASVPLTVLGPNTYPADSFGSNGTAENANSTYGLLPSCPSKSFTQPFGVS
jgi:hypothetical protein